MAEERARISGRLVFGLVVLFVGLLWTMDNMGIVDSERYVRWWPAAVLLFGLVRLFGLDGVRRRGTGALLTVIGGLLLLDTTNALNFSFFEAWPIILILVGFVIATGAFRQSRREVVAGAQDRINVVSLLGSTRRNVGSQALEGGEVSAMMAGATIDLRGAGSRSPEVSVEVLTIWGGVEFIVPENWRVVNEMTVLLGGVDDKSKHAGAGAATTLILRGFVLMGGVDIKN